MSEFDPYSLNAQLATVLERLSQQDRERKLMHEENKVWQTAILTEQKLTNGRVTRLELFKRDMIKISVGVSLAVCVVWKAIVFLWATK